MKKKIVRMHFIRRYILYPVLVIGITTGLFSVAYAATNSNIDPEAKWAWSTNAGWINFRPAHGGVTVYDDHLEGYAWGENIGWIRLGSYDGGGSHTYANDAANTYGVNNDGCGNLSGSAWGANIGWINFNPSHSQVNIDPVTGEFDGYAWAENIGWIHFKNDDGGGPNAYNVATDWRGSLSVAAPTISVAGTDVQLDWAAVSGATSYNIYRSQDDPYFTPGTVYANTTTMPWTDPSAAGNPAYNHYYIVRAVGCDGSVESANSQRLGEFDFGIVPGS